MPDNSRDQDGYVVDVKTDGGVDTVIVTTEGVNVFHCPGGLTEDDLVD
ncbi:hypothetical protein ACIQJT_40940 [Streptomyces sp. NPDC091972]